MKNKPLTRRRAISAVFVLTVFGFQGDICRAAATAAPSAMPPTTPAPAGQYRLDKSHASLLLRVNHLGFSTYTTRFSRFDAELTFDPEQLARVQGGSHH